MSEVAKNDNNNHDLFAFLLIIAVLLLTGSKKCYTQTVHLRSDTIQVDGEMIVYKQYYVTDFPEAYYKRTFFNQPEDTIWLFSWREEYLEEKIKKCTPKQLEK